MAFVLNTIFPSPFSFNVNASLSLHKGCSFTSVLFTRISPWHPLLFYSLPSLLPHVMCLFSPAVKTFLPTSSPRFCWLPFPSLKLAPWFFAPAKEPFPHLTLHFFSLEFILRPLFFGVPSSSPSLYLPPIACTASYVLQYRNSTSNAFFRH